jgi:hypothetical protein
MHNLSLAGLFLATATSTATSLAAQATTGYLVDTTIDQLFSVDLATGAATMIASTLNNGLATAADLSWRAATNELWTVDLGTGALGTIDVATGQFTAVYQTGLSGFQGMAWDETTQLFYLANQSGNNYKLDPATGVTTLLGSAGFSLITSLDTDAAGNLFGTDFTTGALVSINKLTGAGTFLATSVTNIQGLGIDQVSGVWYGANSVTSSLYSINSATGASTLIGPHGSGITFAKGFDLIDAGGGNYATKTSFGAGCYSSQASFFETFGANNTFDLANSTLAFTDLGSGYLALPQAGVPTWHTPTSAPVTMSDDQVLPFALGWVLPYPGGSTNTIYVSSNGFINATPNTLHGCCSFSQTQLLTNGPCWSALWDDLNPGTGGTVTFDSDPVTGDAYVTFSQVPHIGTQNLNTFQYAFHISGQVELLWQACASVACAVGWSPGLASFNPGSMDISAAQVILTGPDTLPLSLTGTARPVLGTNINLTISNIPVGTPLAAFVYGLQKFDPGQNLSNIGMPDCFQYGSQEGMVLLVSPGSSVSYPYNLPNTSWLIGVHVIAQGAVYDPAGHHNALGALSTNGIDLGFDIH